MADETYRKFHAGRYTDRPEATEWKLRDKYREDRESNAEDAKRRAQIIIPVEHEDKSVLKPYEQRTKRKDM